MSDSAEVIIKSEPAGATAPNPEPKPYAGPDYIPEKFRTAEDPAKALAAAYAELEKKQSTPPTESKPGDKKDEPKPGEKKDATQTAAPFDPFFQEYEKDGKLSDASYEALAKQGLSRDVVDAYIAGQEAIASANGNELMSSVGGQETYQAMLQWGTTGLTEAERTAYDNVLASGDMQAAKTMAAALVAKFHAATGQDPGRQITGDKSGASASGAYASMAEMLRDMAKPEYRDDPAFRAQVERKAANSKAW